MHVRPYQQSDRDRVIGILRAIKTTTGTYPPASVENSDEAIGEWLERYFAATRLVAVDNEGTIVGHIQLVPAEDGDPDVATALENAGIDPKSCLESARLFVAPEAQNRGVGRHLKRESAKIAWNLGKRPVSTVMVTQTGSMALNQKEEWVERGRFIGVSGVENVLYVAPEPEKRQSELVHSGVRDGGIGAVATGIEVSTTYTMDEPGKYGEFAYARSQNPTRKALEAALAAAEGGGRAMAFSSGLAAIDAVLRIMAPGEEILLGEDAYGGTWRLLDKVWKKHGLRTKIIDLQDLAAVRKSWGVNTRMIMLETPSNPRMQVCDISALAAIAHAGGGYLIVDNTFATPYLQRPLDLGADAVVHSATKYLGGHSDVIAGALITRNDDLTKEFVFTQKAVGAVPGPFDSFLVLRGMRTLGVRVERQSHTAGEIAAMLAAHNEVERVYYPGLLEHPNHEIAKRQMRAFGGMLSFEVRGGAEAAKRVVMCTEILALAESLGAVESLIEHPHSMTHAANKDSKLSVPEGLVRVSIGLEETWVLARDLQQALRTITPG
jgi:cystathionine gamma-synthase